MRCRVSGFVCTPAFKRCFYQASARFENKCKKIAPEGTKKTPTEVGTTNIKLNMPSKVLVNNFLFCVF